MKTGGTSTCDNTVTFTCDDCYNMTSGSVNRTCLDHSWTGEQPTCESDLRHVKQTVCFVIYVSLVFCSN